MKAVTQHDKKKNISGLYHHFFHLAASFWWLVHVRRCVPFHRRVALPITLIDLFLEGPYKLKVTLKWEEHCITQLAVKNSICLQTHTHCASAAEVQQWGVLHQTNRAAIRMQSSLMQHVKEQWQCHEVKKSTDFTQILYKYHMSVLCHQENIIM